MHAKKMGVWLASYYGSLVRATIVSIVHLIPISIELANGVSCDPHRFSIAFSLRIREALSGGYIVLSRKSL